MSARLKSIRIQNYRSLADVSLELEPVNVLFGPNGAGKSSLLDAIWFVRDCATRSMELASRVRDHGIGLLFDGADEGDTIRLKPATDRAAYELTLSLAGGRLDPSPGERFYSLDRRKDLFKHRAGTSKVEFFLSDPSGDKVASFDLREPEKLALGRYLDEEPTCDEASELDRILRSVHFYHSRSLNIHGLKKKGSETGYETWVSGRGENLWSVLRNLEGRQLLDTRYATITEYMAEAFPTFVGLVIEPTGPGSLYASFLERHREKPILASGVSDGHIQLLTLLTALFSEERGRNSLLLLDEPEMSLHPWAIAVLAKAINHATEKWGRQVILATHSPVLMSQFESDQSFVIEAKERRTQITRLSDVEGIQDLLEQYASGSLYMSESVAGQSRLFAESIPRE